MFQEGEKLNPLKYYNTFVEKLPYLKKVEVGRVRGHPLPVFYDEGQKVSRGKVLLVGDAAHLMDPLMGEGIYYALRSGMMAAESILQAKEKGGFPIGSLSGPYSSGTLCESEVGPLFFALRFPIHEIGVSDSDSLS